MQFWSVVWQADGYLRWLLASTDRKSEEERLSAAHMPRAWGAYMGTWAMSSSGDVIKNWKKHRVPVFFIAKVGVQSPTTYWSEAQDIRLTPEKDDSLFALQSFFSEEALQRLRYFTPELETPMEWGLSAMNPRNCQNPFTCFGMVDLPPSNFDMLWANADSAHRRKPAESLLSDASAVEPVHRMVPDHHIANQFFDDEREDEIAQTQPHLSSAAETEWENLCLCASHSLPDHPLFELLSVYSAKEGRPKLYEEAVAGHSIFLCPLYNNHLAIARAAKGLWKHEDHERHAVIFSHWPLRESDLCHQPLDPGVWESAAIDNSIKSAKDAKDFGWWNLVPRRSAPTEEERNINDAWGYAQVRPYQELVYYRNKDDWNRWELARSDRCRTEKAFDETVKRDLEALKRYPYQRSPYLRNLPEDSLTKYCSNPRVRGRDRIVDYRTRLFDLNVVVDASMTLSGEEEEITITLIPDIVDPAAATLAEQFPGAPPLSARILKRLLADGRKSTEYAIPNESATRWVRIIGLDPSHLPTDNVVLLQRSDLGRIRRFIGYRPVSFHGR